MATQLPDLSRWGGQNILAATLLLISAIPGQCADIVPIVPAKPATVPSAKPRAAPAAVKVTLDGPILPDSPSWSEALRAVLLTAIPDKFEDLSHWGRTREVFGGLNVKQRGFNIRVSERKQNVNNGAWHRYRIDLIDPAKNLKLQFHQIRSTRLNQFQFDLHLASKLRCRGDFEHWVLGVKGLNMTVVSEADVRMVAHCQLTIRTEPNRKSLIPDVILEPRVVGVELELTNLDVKRIGEIRGDIAEGIGDASRHYIENLIQAQEGRVVKKANEAIEKKRRSLRISVPTF